jgi:hypothetical protein
VFTVTDSVGNTDPSPPVRTITVASEAAPVLSAVSPNVAVQGNSNLSVTLTGSNFLSSPTCSFGSGVTVNFCTYNSSTQITANINILSSAVTGARNVTVTNTDGQSSTLTNGFTVQPAGSTGGIGFGSGFGAGSIVLNGNAVISGGVLSLTTTSPTFQASSAWYPTAVNIQNFTTDFSFQTSAGSPKADGLTFTLQNKSTAALGGAGGNLGYGLTTTPSVAVKFDLYNNNGEGSDSTGLYLNGASPTTPAVDMTASGVDLHSGDVFRVHMTYDGTNLTMTITDASTAATFTQTWPVNIPSTVGASTAFAGFTGATGGYTANQSILSWTMSSSTGGGGGTVATPTFSPAPGTYLGTQTVSLSDTTSGATIYYTTDGSTPTTSSTAYNGPITVSATETLKAIAAETGYANSSVATATYTIESQVAAPTFSPAAGSYSSAPTVTISTTSPAPTTIYYTTNGSTPTTSSAVYSGPITVSASETLKAYASKSGYFDSNVSTAAYTIGSTGGGGAISFGSGFTASSMVLNGNAAINGTALSLTTTNGTFQASSAWYPTAVSIQNFTTDFSFQTSAGSPTADGLTFTLQNGSTAQLGGAGGNLGYGLTTNNSVAVKFDLYNNNGEGPDSTGLYLNGASPTTPAVDMTGSGIDLHSGDVFRVHMTYDGTNLAMTITDANTAASFSITWPVNIPSTVGANTAFAGFTGATGGYTSNQNIMSWTMSYSSGGSGTVATPTFSPGAGTYGSTQAVSISDATSGANIYYTTNGSTPTTASTPYSGPITVSVTETLKAIAAETGFTTSNVATASYTIQSQTATPTFSPAAGSYSSAQPVSISDATSGAQIYYTTDGSTPTTGSTLYSGPITVSATETLKAIAASAGFANSNVAAAAYTISSGGGGGVGFGSGFASGSMVLNGNAAINGTALSLTTAGPTFEVASAWFPTALNVQKFTTDFTFQLSVGSPMADGFTFAIQGNSTAAIGGSGGMLGYGNIGKSVGVKFDLYNNAGEGTDSTGLFLNGANPTVPAVDMTSSGVDLHSGHVFAVHIVYDGTNLTITITDTTNTALTFTQTWPVNIPGTVGANTAFVGFTGATGGYTANQSVLTWTYTVN